MRPMERVIQGVIQRAIRVIQGFIRATIGNYNAHTRHIEYQYHPDKDHDMMEYVHLFIYIYIYMCERDQVDVYACMYT